jgi:hypothetical protein
MALEVSYQVVALATNSKSLFVPLLSPHESIFVLGLVNVKRVLCVGSVADTTPTF